jgi:translation initiation factor RLI1
MSPAQEEARQLLEEIDERGKRLDADEITFIADLIDRNVRKFSVGEINRLRALHKNKVEALEDEDDDEL